LPQQQVITRPPSPNKKQHKTKKKHPPQNPPPPKKNTTTKAALPLAAAAPPPPVSFPSFPTRTSAFVFFTFAILVSSIFTSACTTLSLEGFYSFFSLFTFGSSLFFSLARRRFFPPPYVPWYTIFPYRFDTQPLAPFAIAQPFPAFWRFTVVSMWSFVILGGPSLTT